MGSTTKKVEKGPEILVIEVPFFTVTSAQYILNEVCEKGYTLMQVVFRFSDAPIAIFHRKDTKEDPVT